MWEKTMEEIDCYVLICLLIWYFPCFPWCFSRFPVLGLRLEYLLTFLLKVTSWSCLLAPGFRLIFHWCLHWLILAKPLLSSAAELFTLYTTENNEASSANNLALDDNSSARPFIFIKKVYNGPSIETYGTLDLT